MEDTGATNDVTYVMSQYEKALLASEEDRSEAARMRNLYTGFGKGQWSVDAKNRLTERGNIVPQINLSKGKIKRLAGSIVKNYFDVSFIPVASENVDLTRLLNDTFVADSNMFDYTNSYLSCVVDALIHQGCEQMTVSTRYNPLGNIDFEYVQPGHILIDPNWKSDHTEDIKEVFKVAYLTPGEIRDIYGHTSERIVQLLDLIERTGLIYDDDNEDESTPHLSLKSQYGHKFRVVERHYMETKVKVVKFARTDDGLEQVPEDEDKAREFYAHKNIIDKIGNTITRRIQEKTYRVQTCCRELDPVNLIQDAASDIQIGRLPFFPLSAERYGGVNSGIMSLLEDVQKLINSREASIDDIIASHTSGGYLVDPLLVGNNDALVSQVIRDLKRPDAVIRIASGALAMGRNLIQPVPKAPFPSNMYQEVDRMAGYFDSLSGQTATLDGMNESSHDTGTLFAKRAIQSEIALTILTKSLEQHQKSKFEAWMNYAKILYSGAYREVTVKRNNGQEDKIELNKRQYTDTGEIILNNDLSSIARHNVLIVPSKDGLTVRETDRARNIELLQYVQSPIKRVLIEQNALETLDNSGIEKEQLRKYNDIEIQVAFATMEANLAQMKAQTAQMNAQIQQMGAQTQQMNAQTAQTEAQTAQTDVATEQMMAEGETPPEGEAPPVEGEVPPEAMPQEGMPVEEAPMPEQQVM